MKVEEKVWNYLVEHKTPVMAGTLAKRFIISQSHVNSILKQWADKEMLDVINVGRSKFYKIKD